MLLDIAIGNLWVALLIWIGLYISDYVLTLVGARAQAKRAAQSISLQGSYELNAYYVKDVDARRTISPRFILALAWTTFLLAMIWLIARLNDFGVDMFELAFGGLVLLELAVHVRHLRNIFSFRRQMQAGEIQGTIQFARRYVYWVSALDLFLYAGFYLLLYLLVGRIFFLGGVVACGALGIRHRLRMKREPLLTAP